MLLLIIPFSKKSKSLKDARGLLAAGRVEPAVKMFRQLGYRDGLREAGEIYFDQHKFRRAADLFKEAGEQDGLRKVAERLLERGNYSELEKVLGLMYETIPEEKYREIGVVFLERDDLAAAEKAFTAAGDSDALAELASRFLDKNDLSNAVRLFRKLDCPEKTRSIAHSYLERGDLERAEKLFAELDDAEGLRQVNDRRAALNGTLEPRD